MAIPQESKPDMLPLETDTNLIFLCANKDSQLELNIGNYCFPGLCESKATLNVLFIYL